MLVRSHLHLFREPLYSSIVLFFVLEKGKNKLLALICYCNQRMGLGWGFSDTCILTFGGDVILVFLVCKYSVKLYPILLIVLA